MALVYNRDERGAVCSASCDVKDCRWVAFGGDERYNLEGHYEYVYRIHKCPTRGPSKFE